MTCIVYYPEVKICLILISNYREDKIVVPSREIIEKRGKFELFSERHNTLVFQSSENTFINFKRLINVYASICINRHFYRLSHTIILKKLKLSKRKSKFLQLKCRTSESIIEMRYTFNKFHSQSCDLFWNFFTQISYIFHFITKPFYSQFSKALVSRLFYAKSKIFQ